MRVAWEVCVGDTATAPCRCGVSAPALDIVNQRRTSAVTSSEATATTAAVSVIVVYPLSIVLDPLNLLPTSIGFGERLD